MLGLRNRTYVVQVPLAILTLAWGSFTLATATEYYVSPTGNNLNNGSIGSPWLTLQHAADSIAAGDRVVVTAGAYAGFHLTTSGTATERIEFVAEPGVVINSQNPVTPDGVNLEGASYVTIDGFEVIDMPRAGVRSVGFEDDFAEHVTIRNITASDNYKWGIFTGHVNDLLIEHNRTTGAEDEHGIYVSNSGDRPVIRFNEIWDNHANGIHMNGDASLGGDGVISDALVSGNIIYNNGTGGGSGINMDGVQNSRVENNLIYNSHASGISLYQIDGGASSSGNTIVNNTVHQAADGRWALNIQDASSDNKVLNNLLLSEHSFRGALDISSDSLAGFVSDYNVVISRFTTSGGDDVLTLADWQSMTGQDAHSIVAIPEQLFQAPEAGDYHLLPTAVARDSGTAQLAPNLDLSGVPRPWGNGIDRGAYEYFDLSADFNADGSVDGGDFLAWQRGLSPSPWSPAELELWRQQYGGVLRSSSGVGVPEPWGLAIEVLLIVGLASTRRAR